MKFNPFKDFQSDQVQRSSCKIFTAHYAWNISLQKYTVNIILNTYWFRGSTSIKWFLVYLTLGRIVIWQCWFLRRGENRRAQWKKKPSEQRREPTTNSTHIWRRCWDLNPGHIGGRRVLSPLCHPLLIIVSYAKSVLKMLRWLDTVFQGQYLPSLSINYVAINKVFEKLPPQLY